MFPNKFDRQTIDVSAFVRPQSAPPPPMLFISTAFNGSLFFSFRRMDGPLIEIRGRIIGGGGYDFFNYFRATPLFNIENIGLRFLLFFLPIFFHANKGCGTKVINVVLGIFPLKPVNNM